jgi:hypothetical protein
VFRPVPPSGGRLDRVQVKGSAVPPKKGMLRRIIILVASFRRSRPAWRKRI